MRDPARHARGGNITIRYRPVAEAPRHLFDSWPQVARRLRAAKGWLLLLDFDGTLTPITSHPRDSKLNPGVGRILRRLAGNPRARVYVISGRPLAYLRRTLKVPGVHLLGLYGWERLGVSLPAGERRRLLKTKQWLGQRLANAPGIKLEDKGLALAIHYRGARLPVVRRARGVVREALACFQPWVRLQEGRKTWELLPPFIDGKAATARKLLARPRSRWLPICAGDDASDESAFAVIRRGLTIHVGRWTHTRARFWLRNSEEVKEFLGRLEDLAT